VHEHYAPSQKSPELEAQWLSQKVTVPLLGGNPPILFGSVARSIPLRVAHASTVTPVN